MYLVCYRARCWHRSHWCRVRFTAPWSSNWHGDIKRAASQPADWPQRNQLKSEVPKCRSDPIRERARLCFDLINCCLCSGACWLALFASRAASKRLASLRFSLIVRHSSRVFSHSNGGEVLMGCAHAHKHLAKFKSDKDPALGPEADSCNLITTREAAPLSTVQCRSQSPLPPPPPHSIKIDDVHSCRLMEARCCSLAPRARNSSRRERDEPLPGNSTANAAAENVPRASVHLCFFWGC